MVYDDIVKWDSCKQQCQYDMAVKKSRTYIHSFFGGHSNGENSYLTDYVIWGASKFLVAKPQA